MNTQCPCKRRDGKMCTRTILLHNGRCEYHRGLDFYLQTNPQTRCGAMISWRQCKIIGVEDDGYCCFHQDPKFRVEFETVHKILYYLKKSTQLILAV